MNIAIANQKGGCAKTTTAINLAASLAHLGCRTLLIDLDPQAHASMGLGIKTDNLNSSIYNVLSDRSDQKQFVENIIQPYGENLDIAPGHVLLSTIEQEYADKDQAVGRLKTVLDNMVFPYQYVIMDCPPSLGFLTFNALFAANMAIVPIEMGSFSLFGVSKLLSMIELIRVKTQHAPQVQALATMVDLRSRFARKMLHQIQEAFQDNIFKTVIHASVACRESQSLGMSVLAHSPESRTAKNYLDLARDLMGLGEGKPVFGSIHVPSVDAPSRVKDFFLAAQEAGEVYLVGDFNHWRMDENSRLWNHGRGEWQKRILLQPGRYRYKFVVDGRWIPDPANDLAEPNPYGGIDSIIEIQ